MNVTLLNDTYSWYHWGCTATSTGIRKKMRSYGCKTKFVTINEIYQMKNIPKKFSDFDDKQFFIDTIKSNPTIFAKISQSEIVIVNGEGTMHHMSEQVLALLYLMYVSKKHLNKTVFIINHSAYPYSAREKALYKAVYEKLDFIAIREHISHSLMLDLGLKAQLSFDCLPLGIETYIKNTDKICSNNKVVLTNSVSLPKTNLNALGALIERLCENGYAVEILTGAKAFPAYDTKRFLHDLELVADGSKYSVFDAKSLSDWLDSINSAKLLISGRFHHSMAAYFLNTPFVLMDSNTPKNLALTQTFGLQSPLSYKSDDFFEQLWSRVDEALATASTSDRELHNSLIERSANNFKPFHVL